MNKRLREVIHPALLNEIADIVSELTPERMAAVVDAVNDTQRVFMQHNLALAECIVTLIRTLDMAFDQVEKRNAELELHRDKPAHVN